MDLENIRKSFSILTKLVIILIALGGAVRAMDAGMACPDWPLCFGRVIPDFNIKICFEVGHRFVAGLISFLSLTLALKLFRHKEAPQKIKTLMGVGLGVLALQILMGGLTVLLSLHFSTVTMHLALAMTYLGILYWISFLLGTVQDATKPSVPGFFKKTVLAAVALIFVQILLGGLVSSNYAGLACPDFPLCNGKLIPDMSGPQAGLVHIQIIHRLGALTVLGFVIGLFVLARTHKTAAWMHPRTPRLLLGVLMATLTQILIGGMNVWFKIPPLVTVLHLVMAAAIFSMLLRVWFNTTRLPAA